MQDSTNVEEVTETSTPSTEQTQEIAEEHKETSATSEENAETTAEPAPQNTDEEKDRVQERINKITAEKYRYKNERDAERLRLAELEKKNEQAVVDPGEMPTLESCEYDEQKLQSEMVAYTTKLARAEAQKVLQENQNKTVQAQQQRKANEKRNAYAEKTKVFAEKNKDFIESVQAMPLQNTGAAQALLQAGPDVTYHLSKNLDLVDTLNGMSDIEAAVEIGKLSVSLKTVTKKTITNAPDPIETVKGSGSAINTSEPGDELIGGYNFS